MNEVFNVEEIAHLLQKRLGIDKEQALGCLNESFKIIRDLLIADATVRITGFGAFKPEMPANNHTGIPNNSGSIKKKKKIVFTPSKKLKSAMPAASASALSVPSS